MKKLWMTLLVFLVILGTMGTTAMAKGSSKGSFSGGSSSKSSSSGSYSGSTGSKSYSSSSTSKSPSSSGTYSGSTGSKSYSSGSSTTGSSSSGSYSGSSGSKSYSSGSTGSTTKSSSSTGTYSGSSGSKSYSGGTSGTSGSSGSKTYSSGVKTPSSSVTSGSRSGYNNYNNSYQKPSSGWGKFFGGMAAGALVTSMFHPFNHGGSGFFGGMSHPFGGNYAGYQNNGFSFWGFIFDLLILYIAYRLIRRWWNKRKRNQVSQGYNEMSAGFGGAPQQTPTYAPAPIRGVEQPVRMHFNEQDLVDAVCVFAAQRYNVNPQNLMVELFFNPQMGFSATAATRDNYNRFQLNEQDLIDSVAVFLEQQHRFDPHRLAIELFFEEGRGFSAVIDRT